MKEKYEVIAFYERDSRRYRRYVIQRDYEKGEGIVGLIYVPKFMEIPETLVVSLRTGEEVEGSNFGE